MISVLLVDDDERKLSAVSVALRDLGVDGGSITTATDAAAARRALNGSNFDILLLDVLLPARAGSLPSADVSIDFLRQILEDRSLPTPRHVVCITADEVALQQYDAEFRALVTQVLRVDPATDAWKSSLRILIELCTSNESRQREFNYDVCIQTALRTPEYQAVIDAWPADWSAETRLAKGIVFRSGRMEVGGRVIKVACTHATAMGLVAATDLAGKVISELRPRLLLMSGICGGVGSGLAIGDLVVAERAWDWQSGKHDGSGRFLSAIDQKEACPELISHARQVEESLASLDREWRGARPTTRIGLHVAPMVSGSAVVADASIHEVLKSQHRKVAAVDMEAFGVYFAARMSEEPSPQVLCVKAISDLADAAKEDWAQDYCSFLSANFLRQLVERVFR